MRSFWSRSPCIASALKPWRLSDFATTSTSTLRLQKMMPLVSAVAFGADEAAEHLALLGGGGVLAARGVVDDELVDGLGGGRLAGDLDADRVVQELLGDPGDLGRHGGGEEERLAGEGDELEDALDVGDEAHVEHAVGLVDDHDLHAGEHELAALEVVEEAAGGGDQDVDAAVDELVLVLEADAADEERHGELDVRGVFLELLGHLGGELAGRGEHEAARHAGAGAALGEVGDHRQHEGAGLAGAGLGDAEDVAAFERVRDGLDLDRGGGDVAGVGHGLKDPRVQREIGKSGHVACVGFGLRRMAAAFVHAAWIPVLGSRALRVIYTLHCKRSTAGRIAGFRGDSAREACVGGLPAV